VENIGCFSKLKIIGLDQGFFKAMSPLSVDFVALKPSPAGEGF